MTDKLRKIYIFILLPSILGFAFVALIRANVPISINPTGYSEILAPWIFILSVVFAVAWPIF